MRAHARMSLKLGEEIMPMQNVTAFFDSRDQAEAALARLRQDGITDADLRVSPRSEPASSETKPEPETGFWAFLREVFGAAPEYPSYREGLRRGAIMVAAHVEEARVDRACAILEAQGAVDLEAREQQWREEGWAAEDLTGEPTAASRAAQTFSSEIDGGGALAPAAPGESSAASSPAAPGASPATSVEDRSARAVNRGPVRIHNFDARTPADERVAPPEPTVIAETLGARMDEAFAQSEAGVRANAGRSVGETPGVSTRLSENMEVLGADGRHVGVIDHIEGMSVELKKDDPAAHGQHHLIPIEWIASVDQAAKLKLSAADAWSRWTAA
ncbi:DUF2171 domain-containing protein [Rhodoblastus acidophilus]|nr:DUF2171 domain-containing protein [Rhodoblastus acidophilus]RAI18811.1 DUF2171 domain-containing protein [Rhodoblastus acidophilus]